MGSGPRPVRAGAQAHRRRGRAPAPGRRGAARQRDATAAHRAQVEATAAGLTEQLQAAHADADCRREEAAALRDEVEAAQAETAEAREQAAHAAEEQARLAAGHAEWQEQLDGIRRKHDEERAGLHAEAEGLRRSATVPWAGPTRSPPSATGSPRIATPPSPPVERPSRRSRRPAPRLPGKPGRPAPSARRWPPGRSSADETAGHAAAALALAQERAALDAQFEAARQQVAVLTRERDDALAGWDAAARFVHEAEEHARTEMAGLAAALKQAQQDQGLHARQQREAVLRAGELQVALDGQRQRADALAHELEAARKSSEHEHADLVLEVESLGAAAGRHAEEVAALRREVEAARSEAAALREEAAHAAEGKAHAAAGRAEWEQELEGVRQQHDQERAALRAEVERLHHETEHLTAFAQVNVTARDEEIIRLRAETAQALEQTRQQREAAEQAEAARAALAADLERVRAELAEAGQQAASVSDWRDQVAVLTQRFEQERDALLAEFDRLRGEAESLRAQQDRPPAAPPSHGEVSAPYRELMGRVEALRVEVEQLQAGARDAAAARGCWAPVGPVAVGDAHRGLRPGQHRAPPRFHARRGRRRARTGPAHPRRAGKGGPGETTRRRPGPAAPGRRARPPALALGPGDSPALRGEVRRAARGPRVPRPVPAQPPAPGRGRALSRRAGGVSPLMLSNNQWADAPRNRGLTPPAGQRRVV